MIGSVDTGERPIVYRECGRRDRGRNTAIDNPRWTQKRGFLMAWIGEKARNHEAQELRRTGRTTAAVTRRQAIPAPRTLIRQWRYVN